MSTVISTQINEKQKAFSNKKSKKKGVVVSKKAQLQKSGSSEAVDTFELYEGEYDDFM